MLEYQCNTPIVFIIFKRPKHTKAVFETIQQVRPRELFLIADGPREEYPDEKIKCAEVRKIVDKIDWDCTVYKKFYDRNKGLKNGISSGLDWVFSHVGEAIILEDDCLPDLSFFKFCESLLEKYRYDERIMTIAGTNALDFWKSEQHSYHFSNYASIWGWATWQRAWEKYDVSMRLWDNLEIKTRIKERLNNPRHYRVREKRFDALRQGKISTWDTQWLFCSLINSGLTIVPSCNLVSNLGFGIDATHTTNANSYHSNRPTHSIEFPLKDPVGVVADKQYDEVFFEKYYASDLNYFKRLCLKIKSLFPKE